ncbi:hypothetical protein BXU08_02290 [Sphingomonas sp. LM7]|nr:hypothetical protein BXU08_02290 [Sphingomonas sp. LM7]
MAFHPALTNAECAARDCASLGVHMFHFAQANRHQEFRARGHGDKCSAFLPRTKNFVSIP